MQEGHLPPFPPGPARTRPPAGGPGRRLHRSTHNRRIGGVIGGLAEYLGMDATALRVGYVFVSALFLAGIGGVVAYLVAWAVLPDELGRPYGPGGWAPQAPSAGTQGPQVGAPWGGMFSGRPWQDWDVRARSWALVLGTVALAIIWSVGPGPGFSWPAGPVLAVAIWWFVARRRRGWVAPRPRYWAHPGASYPGSPYPGAPHAGAEQAGWTGSGTVPRPGPAAPGEWVGDQAPGPVAGDGEDGHPGGPRVTAGRADPDDADRRAAQAAAAGWAADQLAAAGVPAQPPAGPPPPARQRSRHPVSLVLALFMGLVLLGVVSLVGLTLVSGSSLRGGYGYARFAPASLSQVRADYRLGVGRLQVDLSGLRAPATYRPRTVDLTVGVGRLDVLVPPGLPVYVTAASTGLGRSQVGVPESRRPVLYIDAHVGLGALDIVPSPAP